MLPVLLSAIVLAAVGVLLADLHAVPLQVGAALGLWIASRMFWTGNWEVSSSVIAASAKPTLLCALVVTAYVFWTVLIEAGQPVTLARVDLRRWLGIGATILFVLPLAVVCGLAIAATIGLVRRSPGPLSLRQALYLVYEVPPAIWFALAWVPADPLGFGPASWKAAFGLAAFAIASRVRTPDARPDFVRSALIVLAGVAWWQEIVQSSVSAWDFTIEDVLIDAPGDLYAFIVVAAMGLALAATFVITSVGGICAVLLNAVGTFLLSLYLRLDRIGRCHCLLRHVRHTLTGTPMAWASAAVGVVFRWFVCDVPNWLWPAPVTPARFETYLRHALVKAHGRCEEVLRQWRYERLAGEAPETSNEAAAALAERGRWLLALAGYVWCPRPSCRSHALAPVRWSLIAAIDLHLIDCACYGRSQGKRTVLDRRLVRRLEQIYSRVRTTGDATVIDFRLACLKSPPTDVQRAAFRDAVLGSLPTDPEKRAFAVATLLGEYRIAGDSSGLIEVARRAELRGDVQLQPLDHLSVGEAWYAEALAIAGRDLAGEHLRTWALEQAGAHFYSARSPEHLDLVNSGLVTVGRV